MSIKEYRLEMLELIKHPILAAGISLLLLKALSLISLGIYLGQDFDLQLATKFGLHLGYSGLVISGFLFLWKVIPFLRLVIVAIAILTFAFLTFLTLSDPILQAIIGEKLTPSTLRHFAGPSLFVSDNFWLPVRANWLPISISFGLLVLYIGWLMQLFIQKGLKPTSTPIHFKFPVIFACLSYFAIFSAEALSPSPISPPTELFYAQSILGMNNTKLSQNEGDAIDDLRAFIGLPQDAKWLDETFPLVYGYETHKSPKISSRPDVIVVVIESLRGLNLKFINPKPDWVVQTPNLNKLANNSIVFPCHLSNGFPSGPGFISLFNGLWPHHRRRISTDFGSSTFDNIAARLSSIGYSTLHSELETSFDRRHDWIGGWFDEIIDIEQTDLIKSEKSLFAVTRNWIEKHDTDTANKPFFATIVTGNPHLPYGTPDGKGGTILGASLAENYRKSLSYVDHQLGDLFTYLHQRPRSKNTVLIITGDHANFLDQQTTTGLPTDETAWTGMIVAGPASLVGEKQRYTRPSSHVDILPTILGLVGDRQPSVSLGRDLFATKNGNREFSISIRGGGIRIDREGTSLIIPDGNPKGALLKPRDCASELTPDNEVIDSKDNTQHLKVMDAVRTWSYLLENNRIWSPHFLKQPINK